jgi:hypothetical protein
MTRRKLKTLKLKKNKKSPKIHKMNFFLKTKITIKTNGWNNHKEDKRECQNEIQIPHPSLEKIK